MNLTRLNLSETLIAGPGLKHLKGLKNLASLTLASTAIDDTSVGLLSGLAPCRSMSLYGTQVSSEGLEKVRKALPECNVYK